MLPQDTTKRKKRVSFANAALVREYEPEEATTKIQFNAQTEAQLSGSFLNDSMESFSPSRSHHHHHPQHAHPQQRSTRQNRIPSIASSVGSHDDDHFLQTFGMQPQPQQPPQPQPQQHLNMNVEMDVDMNMNMDIELDEDMDIDTNSVAHHETYNHDVNSMPQPQQRRSITPNYMDEFNALLGDDDDDDDEEEEDGETPIPVPSSNAQISSSAPQQTMHELLANEDDTMMSIPEVPIFEHPQAPPQAQPAETPSDDIDRDHDREEQVHNGSFAEDEPRLSTPPTATIEQQQIEQDFTPEHSNTTTRNLKTARSISMANTIEITTDIHTLDSLALHTSDVDAQDIEDFTFGLNVPLNLMSTPLTEKQQTAFRRRRSSVHNVNTLTVPLPNNHTPAGGGVAAVVTQTPMVVNQSSISTATSRGGSATKAFRLNIHDIVALEQQREQQQQQEQEAETDAHDQHDEHDNQDDGDGDEDGDGDGDGQKGEMDESQLNTWMDDIHKQLHQAQDAIQQREQESANIKRVKDAAPFEQLQQKRVEHDYDVPIAITTTATATNVHADDDADDDDDGDDDADVEVENVALENPPQTQLQSQVQAEPPTPSPPPAPKPRVRQPWREIVAEFELFPEQKPAPKYSLGIGVKPTSTPKQNKHGVGAAQDTQQMLLTRMYDRIEHDVMTAFSTDIDAEMQRLESATQTLETAYDRDTDHSDIAFLRMMDACRTSGDDAKTAELKKKCVDIREFCKLNADTKFLQQQVACQQDIHRQFQQNNTRLADTLEHYKQKYAESSAKCAEQREHNQRLRDFQNDSALQKLHSQIFENDRKLASDTARRRKYSEAATREEQRAPELTRELELQRQRLSTLKQQFADSVEVGARIDEIQETLSFLRLATGVSVQKITESRIELVLLQVVVLAMDYEAHSRRVCNVRITRRGSQELRDRAKDAFSPYLVDMLCAVGQKLQLEKCVRSLTDLQNVMWRIVEHVQHILDLRRNLNRIQMANRAPYRMVVTPLKLDGDEDGVCGLRLRVVIARDVQYEGVEEAEQQQQQIRVQMRTQCLIQCVMTLELAYPYQALQPQIMVVLNRQMYDARDGKFKSVRNRIAQMLIEQRLVTLYGEKLQNIELGADLLGRGVELLAHELNVVLNNEANLKHDVSVYQTS